MNKHNHRSAKRHSLINRNITVRDKNTQKDVRTSIRLEFVEWEAMKNICFAKGISVNEFCSEADLSGERMEHSRTSRIRTAILEHHIKGEHLKGVNKATQRRH